MLVRGEGRVGGRGGRGGGGGGLAEWVVAGEGGGGPVDTTGAVFVPVGGTGEGNGRRNAKI